MANTQKYLNHLLQNAGMTPACSEEERAAAEVVADIYRDHGFDPEVQEFNAPTKPDLFFAGVGILVFVGSALFGLGGTLGAVGFVLALAGCILFALERLGKIDATRFGSNGLSQNVIAYHKAEGPLASPRNRPVVVVAHVDSPRADLLSEAPYAPYRAMLFKVLPYATVAPAALAVVHLLPLPGAVKVLAWLAAIVLSLAPLAYAVSIIANRFVLPYTSGAIGNRSSLATLLGVMDAVAPYKGENEFPRDRPFDAFMAEQRRQAEAAMRAAQAETARSQDEREQGSAGIPPLLKRMEAVVGNGLKRRVAPVEGTEESKEPSETGVIEAASSAIEQTRESDLIPPSETSSVNPAAASVPAEPEYEEVVERIEEPTRQNAEGNYRYGVEELRALGMVGSDCEVVYEDGAAAVPRVRTVTHRVPVERPVVSEEPAVESPVADDARDAEEPARESEPTAATDDVDSGRETSKDVADEVASAPAPTSESSEPAEDQGAVDEGSLDVPAAFADLAERYEGVPADPEGAVLSAEGDGSDSAAQSSSSEFGEPGASDFDGSPTAGESLEEGVDKTVSFGGGALAKGASAPVADAPEPASEAPVPLSASNQSPAGNDDAERTHVGTRVVETVDSLMAEITGKVAPDADSTVSAPSQQVVPPLPVSVPGIVIPPNARQIPPSVPDMSHLQKIPAASRTGLFDLPDPSVKPSDPFAASASAPASTRGFSVVEAGTTPASAVSSPARAVPETDAPAKTGGAADAGDEHADASLPHQRRKGLFGGLFGRKKKQQESMSDWLGVDEDFDAKKSGSDIGSWDNFEDDDDGWKGGAASTGDATPEEMKDAIASMGDDELLGHDIWFVATGASECGNAGIRAFLDEHRDKLRGVFLINLESIGAGELAMLATEGRRRVLKGDRRIMKLVSRVSTDFHTPFATVDMPSVETDAYAAMSMSLRSLTIAGVDGPRFACSHTEEDQAYNIDERNVSAAADVVTEVIRRS